MVLTMTEQARVLNEKLKADSEAAYMLLSHYGKCISFPQKGVISQTAQAKSTAINATIGVACEEDGTLLALDTLASQTTLPKEQAFAYSPSSGQKELRETWQQEMVKKNPSLALKAITLPLVTPALTNGLAIINKLFVGSGDPLILAEPMWENYSLVFDNASFKTFPLFSHGGLNTRGLEALLEGDNSLKKVLLNFPNNPTGYTPTEEEAETLAKIIKNAAERDNKILVVCDDAYFGLFYEDNVAKESLFAKFADLDSRVLAVKIDGCSKEYYAWGLRVGFVTYGFKGMTPASASVLEDKTSTAIRGVNSASPTISQSMMTRAFKDPATEQQKKQKEGDLKGRYLKVKEIFSQNPQFQDYFSPLPFNSGYFMCVQLKYDDAEEVRERLIKHFSTGIIAIDYRTLRIAYSSVPTEKIPKLFENIYKACKGNIDFSSG